MVQMAGTDPMREKNKQPDPEPIKLARASMRQFNVDPDQMIIMILRIHKTRNTTLPLRQPWHKSRNPTLTFTQPLTQSQQGLLLNFSFFELSISFLEMLNYFFL